MFDLILNYIQFVKFVLLWDQTVVVEGVDLEQVAAVGESKIIVRTDSSPKPLESGKGKVIIRQPRRFRLF